LEKRQAQVSFLPELYLLTINQSLTMGMAVARCTHNGAGKPSRRWEVRKLKYMKSDFTLVTRMDPLNAKIQDYFLLPSASLPVNRAHRMRISHRYFGQFAHDHLSGVLKVLTDRINIDRVSARQK
jgi:hypothetical protein